MQVERGWGVHEMAIPPICLSDILVSVVRKVLTNRNFNLIYFIAN